MRLLCAAAVALAGQPLLAQAPEAPGSPAGKTYPDGHGGSIYLPLGDASFADQPVSYTLGQRAPKGVHAQADQAVGLPDYRNPRAPGFTSLGCDGVLVLQFTDNVLVDVAGPDLFVFEVGPAVESTLLAISADGAQWVEVGRIAGARADVDIAGFTRPGEVFTQVRLTNAGRDCGGRTPGADIDTVAAVGAGYRRSVNTAALFAAGSSVPRTEAAQDLVAMIRQLPGDDLRGRLIVEVHSDGSDATEADPALARARADAVGRVLSTRLGMDAQRIEVRIPDATRRLATSPGEAERASRVDLIIVPGS